MNKRVLILGYKGTLGQALLKEFKAHNYQITAWDKEEADVTAPKIVSQIVSIKPDIIINATAYNAVDKVEIDATERKIAFLINAKVPGDLAAIAKKLGAIFVHYSTNYVFSGDKKEGYKETDIPSPINKYGESKLEGEAAVKKVGGKHYVLRLSRLFGIRGISLSSKRTFVEIMEAEQDKAELEVGNTELSSLTYAPDMAKLTRKIIEEAKPWGIYHGTNSGSCTWYGWAKEIFKDLGRGPKVIPAGHSLTPKTTKHPVYSILLNTKLPKQRSWQLALKEFLRSRS